MPNKYRSEIIFPVFRSKELELLHVKHNSAIEQNLLQVTTCYQSKLDKIGHLGYQLKSTNKKVCMTTEHNNFLTILEALYK